MPIILSVPAFILTLCFCTGRVKADWVPSFLGNFSFSTIILFMNTFIIPMEHLYYQQSFGFCIHLAYFYYTEYAMKENVRSLQVPRTSVLLLKQLTVLFCVSKANNHLLAAVKDWTTPIDALDTYQMIIYCDSHPKLK